MMNQQEHFHCTSGYKSCHLPFYSGILTFLECEFQIVLCPLSCTFTCIHSKHGPSN